MIMYTIKGKEYSEFDINKRCAELMDIKYDTNDVYVMIQDDVMSIETGNDEEIEYNPCNSPSETWPIIEKCWDELNLKFITKITHVNSNTTVYKALNRGWVDSKWQCIMEEHKCTKLAAACICLIESN